MQQYFRDLASGRRGHNGLVLPQSKEPIAQLEGVKSNLVETSIDALGSSHYRDEVTNEGIRDRLLSIFVSGDRCDYRRQPPRRAPASECCFETMVNGDGSKTHIIHLQREY